MGTQKVERAAVSLSDSHGVQPQQPDQPVPWTFAPDLYRELMVEPGSRVQLGSVDANYSGEYESYERSLPDNQAELERLDRLQYLMHAEGKRSLLIVLQGVDASGKDGVIRHILSGLNPAGCRVKAFKQPSPVEMSHDFLWRIHPHVPTRGEVAIFNRSHYEDVLVTRVHGDVSPAEAKDRFRAINRFEQQLAENGTTILKFYLAISKAEQRRRLQARVDDPQKRWKFSTGDVAERRHWDAYMKVYADACAATCTPHAPWYPVPANHKWYRNYLVAKIVAATLKKMHPRFPVSRGPSNIRIR
jgi:PPK2 family polyphosphate:nucleotide phosphotransferase